MKINVSEASGPVLDWLVAKCEKREASPMRMGGPVHLFRTVGYDPLPYQPSTDWAQGGPIIEREFISVFDLPSGLDITEHPTFNPGDLWEAEFIPSGEDSIRCCGPTPLIAAMRCYVASKLCDVVEVPEELV